jgi:hypothetical protein
VEAVDETLDHPTLGLQVASVGQVEVEDSVSDEHPVAPGRGEEAPGPQERVGATSSLT